MGLLSSSVSITRYQVNGTLSDPLVETVGEGLRKNAFPEIENDESEITIGWSSFENPYLPDFSGSSFVMGTCFLFCFRIDKKTIPPKVIKKHCALEMEKRLSGSGRKFLTKSEKQDIREQVAARLYRQIPSVPNIYEVVWNYETSELFFFTNLKSANEEFETLFSDSFTPGLIRLFPYSLADLKMNLSDVEKDVLSKLSRTKFTD